MSSEACKSCQSSALEEEDGMIVCTSCGKVAVGEGVIRHDDSQNSGMSNPETAFMSMQKLPNRIRNEVLKRPSAHAFQKSTPARIECFLTADRLSKELCFTRDMKSELKTLLTAALSHEFNQTSRETKNAVASVCAYITMIRNGRSVTVSDICRILKCGKEDFASQYYKYLSKYPQNHPGLQKLSELIPCTLKGLSFDEPEKYKIYNLTEKILQLLDQVLLIESKCPTLLIFAASYIAWKSVDCKRSAIRFQKFKTIIGVSSDLNLKRVNMHVKELEDKLISMTTSFPWLRHYKITRANISEYLNEVLQHQSSIIYDLKSQTKSPDPPELLPSDAFALLVDEVNGDGEISDSEIDSYIRSADEISQVKRLKASCDDE